MYEQIKNYLEREPRARERRYHQRGMVNLLLQRFPIQEMTKDRLIEFCHAFESYCRIWRKVVSENEELRGKDYDTKDIVEQEHILNLGYEVGYHQDVKQLAHLK